MTEKQVRALRLMIRKETLAAVLEGEAILYHRDRRPPTRDIEHRVAHLRYEAEQHAQEAIE